MSVSVIIPLYNKASTIERTLASVLSQSITDLEVIIVDDGSTDRSADRIRRCRDVRLRLISQENAGPGAARNRGLSSAHGEYIAFIDSDDYWLPTFLADSLALFAKYGAATTAVASAYCLDTPDNSMAPFWQSQGLTEELYYFTPETSAEIVVALLRYLNPCNTLVRTDFIRKLGGYYAKNRCRYGEDTYIEIKMAFNGHTALSMTPLVVVDSAASGLSAGSLGPHPLEPFFMDPAELFAMCPPPLHDLLQQVLSWLAVASADEFAYWGKLQEARALLRGFSHPRVQWTSYRLRTYLATIPFFYQLRRIKHRMRHNST